MWRRGLWSSWEFHQNQTPLTRKSEFVHAFKQRLAFGPFSSLKNAKTPIKNEHFSFPSSFFGRAFEKAAENTSSRTLHDHFDTSGQSLHHCIMGHDLTQLMSTTRGQSSPEFLWRLSALLTKSLDLNLQWCKIMKVVNI